MKKVLTNVTFFLLLTILASSCGNSTKVNEEEVSKAPEKFTLGTGVNVSHWLSQSKRRGVERANQITKKDFDSIAAMGFDHVRIPVDEEHIYDEQMNRDEDAFVLLDSAINWAFANNLNVIFDLHVVRSHHFNNENEHPNTLFQDPKEQDKLEAMWLDLQKFLKKYPNDKLAYELLNEAVAPDNEDWNKLVDKLTAAIRKEEKERTLIIGSNKWQIVYTFNDLKVPANDKNIILSFHYYDPSLITHYRAPWTDNKDYDGAVNYPGMIIADTSIYKTMPETLVNVLRSKNGVWNAEKMEQDILMAINKAKSLGLPLYCGEFGAYPTYIDSAMRIKWYEDMVSIFRKHNIANAHWCYKGDFPIVGSDGSRNELPAILLKK